MRESTARVYPLPSETPEIAAPPSPQPRAARTWSLALLFVTGLLLLDRAVSRIGDSQIRDGFWGDNPYSVLLPKEGAELVLLGDCRPLVLDAEAIERTVGKKTVNLGTSSSATGHVAFAVNVMLSHPRPLSVALFLNGEILAATDGRYRDELERLHIWWAQLTPGRQASLDATAGLTSTRRLLRASGLWKYRGRGFELAKAEVRRLRAQKPPRHFSEDRNFFYGKGTMVGRAGEFTPPDGSWRSSRSALAVVEALVRDTVQAGMTPVLVLSPMHRLYGTREENERVAAIARDLAKRYGVAVLDYLTENTLWNDDDDLWSNPGHMNRAGVDAFTPALAADLRRVLR